MDTIAERDDDSYVINGTKQFVTNANVVGSVLVRAVTDPDAGYDGVSTFIVNPENGDGFEVTTKWGKMGLNSSPTCELSFDDCWVSGDHLLGGEGGGWKRTMRTLDDDHISTAALSVRLVEGVCGHAKSYAQEHEWFDRPVSKFDAIHDRLISVHRKTERARLLIHKAATRCGAGKRIGRESASAKLDTSEAAREAAEGAVQVLDGYDYTTDFAPQRFYRDAKLVEIDEGTSGIQRLIIGRELGL